MNHEGEDRRTVGDRRESSPGHVVVDGLTNGAREFVLSLDKRLSVLTKLLAVVTSIALPIALTAAVGIIQMGREIEHLSADMEYVPTRPAIEEMIERRTAELRAQIIDTAAESDVAKQLGSEGLNSLATSVEVLRTQQEGLRRDVDNLQRRVP